MLELTLGYRTVELQRNLELLGEKSRVLAARSLPMLISSVEAVLRFQMKKEILSAESSVYKYSSNYVALRSPARTCN